MKTVAFEIEIVEANCTGCYRCERACPTSAITMVGPAQSAVAVVDNSACIACMRCIDSCDDDAMFARERAAGVDFEFDLSSSDPDAVGVLCAAATLDPEKTVCLCSGSQAKEIAAAIIGGSSSFEEVALATGAQSGCLIYCSVPIRRLLAEHTGLPAESGSKVRRYPCAQSVLDIPASVAADYPMFAIAAEQQLVREQLTDLQVEW